MHDPAELGRLLVERYAEQYRRERQQNPRGCVGAPERWLVVVGDDRILDHGDPTGQRGTWPTDPAELGGALHAAVRELDEAAA